MKLNRRKLRNLIIQEMEKIGEDSLRMSHDDLGRQEFSQSKKSSHSCHECGAMMEEEETTCHECGSGNQIAMLNESGCGHNSIENTNLGNFYDLNSTNIEPDDAFLAGHTVGSIDGLCDHEDWSPACVQNDQEDNMFGLESGFGKHDHTGAYMAKSQLYKVSKYSQKLYNMIPDNYNLDDWMRTKLAQISDDISEVYHALDHDEYEGEL